MKALRIRQLRYEARRNQVYITHDHVHAVILLVTCAHVAPVIFELARG